MRVRPDSLVLQARLCGFTAFVATESEWALPCGSVVTSYGSRQCLPLGDPVPPCKTDPDKMLVRKGEGEWWLGLLGAVIPIPVYSREENVNTK